MSYAICGCMNQLLFERSTGNIGANVFAKLQTSQLLHSFRPAPRFRFDGGERGVVEGIDDSDAAVGEGKTPLWSHQAGVNALASDRFDGRL